MPEFLYIGQNTSGTTSAMRCNHLFKILHKWHCSVIDTNAVFQNQARLFKSLAFRYNYGPAIWTINRNIVRQVTDRHYDLIWIDKGIFIKKKTLAFLKRHTGKLVHYTPDAAFAFRQSRLFNKGIKYYDYLITTKSYELNAYYTLVSKEKVILTTQGFDKDVHYPQHLFAEKKGVIMIGLYEPYRGKIVRLLLEQGVYVKVAGVGWKGFAKKNSSFDNLKYLGNGLFGVDYAKAISSSLFGLGLLSKKFPELHTTRTFEIPACGTALVTEVNEEIKKYYDEDEVVFFNDYNDLVGQIKYLERHRDKLESVTKRGYEKVLKGRFDYDSILRNIVFKIIGNSIMV